MGKNMKYKAEILNKKPREFWLKVMSNSNFPTHRLHRTLKDMHKNNKTAVDPIPNKKRKNINKIKKKFAVSLDLKCLFVLQIDQLTDLVYTIYSEENRLGNSSRYFSDFFQ